LINPGENYLAMEKHDRMEQEKNKMENNPYFQDVSARQLR